MSFKIPTDFVKEDLPHLDLKEPNPDMYLIRVPKGFDISKLHGTKFSPNEVKKIEVGEESNGLTPVYELVTLNGQNVDVKSLVKSAEGKTTLGPPLAGYLSVNKSYSMNPDNLHPTHAMPVSGRVPMPEGLKERFTPFGADLPFKMSSTQRKKKKRKHSHNSFTSASTPEVNQDVKRRKVDEADSVTENSAVSSKKHKRRKKKHGSHDDVAESTQIGSHDVSSPVHLNGDMLLSESPQSHKKKGEKVNINDSSSPNETFKTPINHFKAKHQKRKHSGDILSPKDSIFIDRAGDRQMRTPDLLDGHIENDIVGNDGDIPDSGRKKRKRKLSSGYFSSDISLNCSSSDHLGSESKKKKKKRRHDDDD